MAGALGDKSNHRCPPDPIREQFGDNIYLACAPGITIKWDHWSVCTISCFHGSVTGGSCQVNFTECIASAIAQFNNFDHDSPARTRNTGEGMDEYVDRAWHGHYDNEVS